MTTVMFLLGALFVALVVTLMYTFSNFAFIIAVGGIGIAFYQWWASDKVAMRAMRAREVSPEEAPELHGMIDRLCALADMPKPRVGVSDLPVANAFATGRSPDRAVVCVTTGILQKLDAEELEAVLAHELSHVAHRDVLVMTIASSAGIAAGLLMRFTQFGGMGRSRGNNNSALPVALVVLLVSLFVYAVSFVMLRVLSRYRELCADRSGAYLTMKPAALASALQKISGEPAERLRGRRWDSGRRCARGRSPSATTSTRSSTCRARRSRSRPRWGSSPPGRDRSATARPPVRPSPRPRPTCWP